MKITLLSLIAILFSCSSIAGVIDFEVDALGKIPADNQRISFSDVFMTDGISVQFGFDTTGDGAVDMDAMFEQVGNKDTSKDTGFWRKNGRKDIAASGYREQLGDFFLRQSTPYALFHAFMIFYNSPVPVTQASGEIWDIDGKKKTEQFSVSAYNGETLLETILSPLGDDQTLDGKPWTFGFSGLSNITQINIAFIGSKNKGTGLALNNFSPETDLTLLRAAPLQVSAPQSAWLMLLTVFLLSYFKTRY